MNLHGSALTAEILKNDANGVSQHMNAHMCGCTQRYVYDTLKRVTEDANPMPRIPLMQYDPPDVRPLAESCICPCCGTILRSHDFETDHLGQLLAVCPECATCSSVRRSTAA